MSAFWGTPCWIFFHTLAEKIKPDYYLVQRDSLIRMINEICNLLPCPICSRDAHFYLKKVNFKTVPTKKEFIAMFIHFHNTVNLKLGKQKFNMKFYDIYKKKNLNQAFAHFKRTYTKKYNAALNSQTLNEIRAQQQRKALAARLTKWFDNNKDKFES